ncbi:MAG: hypothetical protein ACX93N_08100 [Pseudohaliea sp.]
MGRVIDINPIFERRQLKGTNRGRIAFQIARSVCSHLGVKPDGVMYRRYIFPLPSKHHMEAVVLWVIANDPNRLEQATGTSIRELARRIDADVRRVIPEHVFWSHH